MSDETIGERFLMEKLFSFAKDQGHLAARQDSAEKAIDRLGDEIVKAQNHSALHISGEMMRLEQRIDTKLEVDRAQTRRQLQAMSDASQEATKILMRTIVGVGLAIVAGLGALEHIDTITQVLEIFRR